MKIDTYGQAKVGPQSVRAPAAGVPEPGGFGALRAGLGQVVQAGEEIGQQYDKMTAEAEAVDARDALNEYEKRQTARLQGDTTGVLPSKNGKLSEPGEQGTSTEGFLSTRGKAAAAASAKVFEDLDGDAQEIGGKLKSDRARHIFDLEVQKRRTEALRVVEGHVSNEIERAKFDSIKVATDNAVRDAAMSPADDELAGDRIASAAAAAAEMASSPEAAENAALNIHGTVTKARLDQLLANSDTAAAERVLGANRRALGADADKYDKAINNVKLGAEAQTVAFGVVQGALDKDDGQVDQAKVLDGLEKLPAEKRAKVEPIVYKLTAEREQAYAADTKRISNAAFALYNTKGWGEFEKSGLSTDLNYRNPELYNRLRDDAHQQLDRAKRLKRDSAEDRRRQTEMNKVAVQEFLALPTEEQANADVGQFLLNRGTGGVSSDKDPVPSTIADLQKKARDQVTKGLAVPADAFMGEVHASLQKFAPSPGTTKESRARAAAWWADHMSDARNAYSLWLDNNQNKKPTREDLDKIKATAIGGLPPNPQNPESITEAGRAISTLGGGATGRAPPASHVDIPASERAQIEGALRKKGKVITEDAIQALFRQVHGGR